LISCQLECTKRDKKIPLQLIEESKLPILT